MKAVVLTRTEGPEVLEVQEWRTRRSGAAAAPWPPSPRWSDEGCGSRCDPERDLGVPVRVLDGSDIAYDVHVRRVFLRGGLAKYDDLTHMVAVARQATPNALGVIDFGGAGDEQVDSASAAGLSPATPLQQQGPPG
jgi:hypothetical protein